MRAAMLGLGLVPAASPAMAAVRYDYSGNAYTTISDSSAVPGTFTPAMRVAGTIVLATPLAAGLALQPVTGVLSFSLDSGMDAISGPAGAGTTFQFSAATDAGGQIVAWSASAYRAGAVSLFMSTQKDASGATYDYAARGNGLGSDTARVANAPGSWTVTTVPEPATWAMVLGGFAMVGIGMRRGRMGAAAA